MIKVHLSFDGKLSLLSIQFFIETVLADDLNVVVGILVGAVSLKSLHNFPADCRLQYNTVAGLYLLQQMANQNQL